MAPGRVIKMMSARIDEALYQRVKAYCVSNRISVQEFLTDVIEAKMQEVDPGGRLKGVVHAKMSMEERMERMEKNLDRLAGILSRAATDEDNGEDG